MLPSPHAQESNEPSARPKFSRRPASFARLTPESEEPILTSEDEEPAERRALVLAPVPTALPWQEDARFGVVMLMLLALINLALIYGLPLLPQHETVNQPTHVTAKAPSMPVAIGQSERGVTLYSQPAEERRTVRLLNLRNHVEEDGFRSHHDDMPIPTARALDDHSGDLQ